MTALTAGSRWLSQLMSVVALLFLGMGGAAADDVSAASQRWANAGISNYSFTLTNRVMWGATTIVLIKVRDGKLVTADHIIKRTNPVPDHPASEDSGLRKTIADLFEDIATREDFVEATFHPEQGYPVDVYFQNADFAEAVDQFEIRDFTVLNDAA